MRLYAKAYSHFPDLLTDYRASPSDNTGVKELIFIACNNQRLQSVGDTD